MTASRPEDKSESDPGNNPVANSDIKVRIRQILDESGTRWGVAVNGAIALLILLSTALFAIQTYPLPKSICLALQITDQIILALFTLEYVLRLWAAERPLRFCFQSLWPD